MPGRIGAASVHLAGACGPGVRHHAVLGVGVLVTGNHRVEVRVHVRGSPAYCILAPLMLVFVARAIEGRARIRMKALGSIGLLRLRLNDFLTDFVEQDFVEGRLVVDITANKALAGHLLDLDASEVGAREVLDLIVGVLPLDASDHACALVLDLRVDHLVHVSLILVEYGLPSRAAARRPQIRLSLDVGGLAPKRRIILLVPIGDSSRNNCMRALPDRRIALTHSLRIDRRVLILSEWVCPFQAIVYENGLPGLANIVHDITFYV